MPKIFSIIGCLCLLFFSNSLAFSQLPIEKILTSQKWGLRQYVEIVGTIEDTLFSVQDCDTEFLRLSTDHSYEYGSAETNFSGKWTVDKDSLLWLLKSNGKPVVTLKVIEAKEDLLTLLELSGTNIFVSQYAPCGENEHFVHDSRVFYEEPSYKGVGIAFQAVGPSQVIELGYAWSTINYKNTCFGVYGGIELAPLHGWYGAGITGYSATRFTFGMNLNVATNLEKVQLGVKPILGFSLKGIGGNWGAMSHLVYSYNYVFVADGINKVIPDLNRQAITFRFMIPVKKTVKVVRKMEFFD